MPLTVSECRDEIISLGWFVCEMQRKDSWQVVARRYESSLICIGARRNAVWLGALDGVQRVQAGLTAPNRGTEFAGCEPAQQVLHGK
jgi:hypothetical protein